VDASPGDAGQLDTGLGVPVIDAVDAPVIGHRYLAGDVVLDPYPVWVLVVAGLGSRPPHVSLHPRRSGAEDTLTAVTGQHLAVGGHVNDLTITLVARTPATD